MVSLTQRIEALEQRLSVATAPGTIMLAGFPAAPQGWEICDGRLLGAQAPYDRLFAVIRNRFGGDGVNNFCLPDLRGRSPIGAGLGAGLTNRPLGESGGTETIALTMQEMPSHDHTLTRYPWRRG